MTPTETQRAPAPTEDAEEAAGLYRLIAETIPHKVWTARADGALDFFNRRCLDYTGIDNRGLEGWGWKSVVHPDDWDRCLATWTRSLQSGERYDIEYRLRRADGAYRWHHGSAAPMCDADGRPQRWFGTCTDIEGEVRGARILEEMVEERSRALRETVGRAEQVARGHSAELRRLMHRLVTAQESERRRLADDLHDLIGQNLTALGIELASLEQRLRTGASPEAFGPRVEAMKLLVEKTIDSIRGVMTDLRPPALEEYGLVAALRAYATEFAEHTGMKVTVSADGRVSRLGRESELALFRIVQEALTNAAKHSGGTLVHLSISEHGEALRLAVEDDGRGFANPVGARSARRGGWGLPTMRERAEAHSGSLRVEFPGTGTRLVVEIPRAGAAAARGQPADGGER